MIYLLAVILLNTYLSVLFKLFPRFRVDTLQAIVVNYWTCVVTGSLFLGDFPVSAASVGRAWFPWALFMGLCFISIFNLIAYCTRHHGITATTIANKLSLVIPALFSIFYYGETQGWPLKSIGIALALPAVYLATQRNGEGEPHDARSSFLWLVLLFLGSGMLDTLVNYVQATHLPTPTDQATYTIHVFLTAALAGTVIVLVLALDKKIQLHPRNLLAGILLGVPNYFSIYLLIRLLNSRFLQSSAAIPVSNIGVVVSSSLAAILLFREKAGPKRWLGLVLAVLAIFLIAYNDLFHA